MSEWDEEQQRRLAALDQFLADVRTEAEESYARYGPLNSEHEAFGVLLEEIIEVLREVMRTPSQMRSEDLRIELVQVAAVAERFAVEVKSALERKCDRHLLELLMGQPQLLQRLMRQLPEQEQQEQRERDYRGAIRKGYEEP